MLNLSDNLLWPLTFSAKTSVLQVMPAMVKVTRCVCHGKRATRLVPQLGAGTNAWDKHILKLRIWQWLLAQPRLHLERFLSSLFAKLLHCSELLWVYSCCDWAPLLPLSTTGTPLSSAPEPSPKWGKFLQLLVCTRWLKVVPKVTSKPGQFCWLCASFSAQGGI